MHEIVERWETPAKVLAEPTNYLKKKKTLAQPACRSNVPRRPSHAALSVVQALAESRKNVLSEAWVSLVAEDNARAFDAMGGLAQFQEAHSAVPPNSNKHFTEVPKWPKEERPRRFAQKKSRNSFFFFGYVRDPERKSGDHL